MRYLQQQIVGEWGGIFVADIDSSREGLSISPTLKDESVTNAVFGIVVAFAHV
jgi:hypothetical protein